MFGPSVRPVYAQSPSFDPLGNGYPDGLYRVVRFFAARRLKQTSGFAVTQELKRQRLIITGEEKVPNAFDRGVDSTILGSVPASVEGILAYVGMVLVGLVLGIAVLAGDLLYA